MPLQQTVLLHGDSPYRHYYLCNYLPLYVGKDSLSLSLLKFKRGRQPDLNAWIDCSLEMLGRTDSSIISPGSILLRALHHDETSVHEDIPTSLDKLGKTLADHFQCHYCPYFLRKYLPTQEIKGLNKEQRAAELGNRYYIDPRYIPSPSPFSFLIIDDILTTGTTMQMIITAMLQSSPEADLTIFTLAKADYDNYSNQPTPFRTYDFYGGPSGNHTVSEEENYTSSPASLKARILGDAF